MTRLLTSALLLSALAGHIAAQSKDLLDLAATERAFAAETVKVGFRDGFIKYFADDGIGFGPHPERTREKLQQLPPATGPRKVIFNWAPMFGDISSAGDLGYTTGPVLYTDAADPSKVLRHGMYFSVWQKQADGSWKVAIDMGIDVPGAVAPLDIKFTAATPVGVRRPNPMKGTPQDDYRGLDGAMSSVMAKTRPGPGGLYNFDPQVRVHRKGMMPIGDGKGLGSLKAWATKYERIDGKIARSGDLAFTYGKYTEDPVLNTGETGYYVHVWRRNVDSEWRLVVDVQNPLPKPTN